MAAATVTHMPDTLTKYWKHNKTPGHCPGVLFLILEFRKRYDLLALVSRNTLRDLLHSCRPKLHMVHESLVRDPDIERALGRLRKLLLRLTPDVPEQIPVRRLGDRKYLNLDLGKLSAAANPRSLHLDQAI
jgi:hypothetical protein